MYTLNLSYVILVLGLCVGLTTVTSLAQKNTIKLATFNIQNLGTKKASDDVVVHHLKQIMSRYDLIAVQEIQDKTGKAVELLKTALNKNVPTSKKYSYELSDRVGSSPGEVEQYALFYRPSVAKVVKSAHYDDSKNIYSRVPFLTKVKFQVSGMPTIVIVNLHTRPDATKNKVTVQEIDHLFDVYTYIKKSMDISDVMFVGDLNADGQYVVKRDWKNIRIRNDPRFVWLISDDVDTTVGNTHMAYDRIIVAGSGLIKSTNVSSVHVYRYDEESSKSGKAMDKNMALEISDHYPVEVQLRPAN